MNRCRMPHPITVALAAILLLLPLAAQAESWIRGSIEAEEACLQELGQWRYTLTIEWSNATGHDMSHFNLSLGAGTECGEEEISRQVRFQALAGFLYQGGWNVPVGCYASFERRGDPSLGITEPLLKFEPCTYMQRPVGDSGVGKVVFWSDHAPADILMPNRFLSEKFGRDGITGEVTGVFPGLPCDPVAGETMDWGRVKSTYR